MVGIGRVPAGDLYVVDRKGQLVFHRQRTLASQARDYAGVPVVQRLLRGEEGLAELGNPVDGEVGLHAYRWLPTLGWGVVVHRSKNLALQRTRTLLLVAAAFTCALAVGIAGTAWLAVRARQRLETQATALGEAERRARLASERAEKSSRAKSEFLATMSHELRTPLNAIIGFSELMHDGKTGSVSADQQEFLGDILASSRHLLQLINDVLDLSKVESGKMEFHPEPVDLAKLVDEIQDVLRGVAAGKRIRLAATVDPGIGPVVLDPAKLKQVLYNFLSNAVKFTPEAGRVSVRAAPEGPDAVRLEVEDTGIGIRAEDLERLFVEFQQLDAGPARTHEGTGLGLALTKRLVEAQGGRVGVRSTLGQGSVFFAILPRVARSSEVAATPSAPPRAARAGAPTILVIEDEAPDRAWLEQVFTATGYAVEAVASGAEAVARARVRVFDAITLDLLLPDVMAHDLVAAIRAEGPNRETPILVVTVVAEREAAAGFVVHDFLTKPVRSEDLLASLARAKVTPDAPRPVLVVEDDPVSLRLAETALAGRGYRVVGAASGAAGLEAAEAESPAALVLDLKMPGMDGFDFLARYRATPDGRRTPVIVWTAKDLTHEDRVRLDGAVARVVAKRHGGNGPLLEALDTVIRPA